MKEERREERSDPSSKNPPATALYAYTIHEVRPCSFEVGDVEADRCAGLTRVGRKDPSSTLSSLSESHLIGTRIHCPYYRRILHYGAYSSVTVLMCILLLAYKLL